LAALALVDALPAVEIPPLPIPPLVRYKVGRRGAGLNPRRVEESTGLRAEEGERAAEEAEERAREVAEGATTRNGQRTVTIIPWRVRRGAWGGVRVGCVWSGCWEVTTDECLSTGPFLSKNDTVAV